MDDLDADVVPRVPFGVPLEEDLAAAPNAGQGVSHFVGNHGGQFADGGQTLALEQLELELLERRHVPDDSGRSGKTVRRVVDRRHGQRKSDRRPVLAEPAGFEVAERPPLAQRGIDTLDGQDRLVARRDQALRGLPQHLHRRPSEDRLGRGVPRRDEAGRITHDDRVGGPFDDARQEVPRRLECLVARLDLPLVPGPVSDRQEGDDRGHGEADQDRSERLVGLDDRRAGKARDQDVVQGPKPAEHESHPERRDENEVPDPHPLREK